MVMYLGVSVVLWQYFYYPSTKHPSKICIYIHVHVHVYNSYMYIEQTGMYMYVTRTVHNIRD